MVAILKRNIVTFAVFGIFAVQTSSAFAVTSSVGSSASLMTEMNAEAIQFDRVSKVLPIKDDCVPLRVGGVGRIDIQYLACSAEAKSNDEEAYRISDNITVPQGLSHRFNFWRRVYSLWSKNQYVLHVAEIPEIVLEIHDSSRIADLGDKTREKVMKPWLTVRRQQYRAVLLKLHAMKSIEPSQLTMTESRIVKLFEHVERKDKYLVAAQSLRIQRGQREYIAQGLETASKYLPLVEESFKKEGLPPEFARIAFIESSFNLQAMSKVGASGVYQIMPQTGRDYLILDGGIDERNDPIKASRAAAKLLILNYKILGQWPLAITAYNHGVGGIRRAMVSAGSSDIVTLIHNYDGPNFGFASKNFYAGFLGLLATLENSEKVFPAVKVSEPLKFDVARVGGLTVSQAKEKYRMTSATLASLNPDVTRAFIRSDGVFPARFVLKVPSAPSRDPAIRLANVKAD